MILAAIPLTGILAVASVCAVIGGALVGLIFRGAAAAWREERDAAVEKSDRLEVTVNEQAEKITTLELKVDELEKRTDYEAYAERSGREHQAIIDTLEGLKRSTDANTTAVEFLLKQVFPTAVTLTAAAEAPAA